MNSLSPHMASSVTCFCQCIHNFQFQKAKVWFSLLLFGCDDHSCIIIWLLWIGCGWGWCGLNRLGAESSVPANLTKYGAALSMPLVICTIRWISRPLAAYHHWFLSRWTETNEMTNSDKYEKGKEPTQKHRDQVIQLRSEPFKSNDGLQIVIIFKQLLNRNIVIDGYICLSQFTYVQNHAKPFPGSLNRWLFRR